MNVKFSAVEATLEMPDRAEGFLAWFEDKPRMSAFHRHRELEFNLARSGSASYLLDDRRYNLKPNTLVWLFPGQHHILLDNTPDFTMWVGVARPELVGRLFEQSEAHLLTEANPPGDFCRVVEGATSDRLHSLFHTVQTAQQPPERFNAGLAFALWETWCAFQQAPARAFDLVVHPAVGEIARLLQRDTEAVTLKQLSQQFGLSPSRLSELFHQQTGVPLARYRNRRRLERFLVRCVPEGNVALSQEHIREAARDAGFGSYAQFYRVFREVMDSSPTEFARRQGTLESNREQ